MIKAILILFLMLYTHVIKEAREELFHIKLQVKHIIFNVILDAPSENNNLMFAALVENLVLIFTIFKTPFF